MIYCLGQKTLFFFKESIQVDLRKLNKGWQYCSQKLHKSRNWNEVSDNAPDVFAFKLSNSFMRLGRS